MRYLAAALLASAMSLSSAIQAAEPMEASPRLFSPSGLSPGSHWLLAQGTSETTTSKAETGRSKALHLDFEEPTFTGEKMHQYLGLATLGFVALTAISPKEEGGPHELFGNAAAVTAGATVGTGLVYHWEDFHLSDGLTEPDNLHMMLGSIGALMMAAAVSRAPEAGHPGLGIGGGALMATAVKITW
jgi:hypothetical protein